MHVVEVYQEEEQLTRHFKVSEFQCHNGSWPVLIHERLLNILEDVRQYFGSPVRISSGYRTPEYNQRVGGVINSYHTLGMAADIKVDGINPEKVADYLEGNYPESCGIGRYKTFTHIDCRPNKARWGTNK